MKFRYILLRSLQLIINLLAFYDINTEQNSQVLRASSICNHALPVGEKHPKKKKS
jgi:hypothetical protein